MRDIGEILNSREKIIKAALELFSNYGYRGTTTKVIAENAGVSEMTFFRQFKNKIGVLKEVLALVLADQVQIMDFDFIIFTDPQRWLQKIAEIEIRNAYRYGGLVLRLILEAQTSSELMTLYKSGPRGAGVDKFSDNILKLQENNFLRKDIEASVIAETFLNLVFMHVMNSRLVKLGQPVDVEDIIRDSNQLINIYWQGIKDLSN